MRIISSYMATSKQFAANRAKSAKSHSPTNVLLLEAESRTSFTRLLDSYIVEFQPETTSEMELVQKLAASRWHLTRTWAIHSATRPRLAMRVLADNTRHADLMSRALEALTTLRNHGNAQPRPASAAPEIDKQIAGTKRSLEVYENK